MFFFAAAEGLSLAYSALTTLTFCLFPKKRERFLYFSFSRPPFFLNKPLKNGARPRCFHGGSSPRPPRRGRGHERRDGDFKLGVELGVVCFHCRFSRPGQAVWLPRCGPRLCVRCVSRYLASREDKKGQKEKGEEGLEHARTNSAVPPTTTLSHQSRRHDNEKKMKYQLRCQDADLGLPLPGALRIPRGTQAQR